MDTFLLRKKQKTSRVPKRITSLPAAEEEEADTDVKLATLASVYDNIDQSLLLEALITAEGSVKRAAEALEIYREPKHKVPSSPSKVIGYQSLLSSFRLGGKDGEIAAKSLTKKGQTLHLYAPEDIAAHTPCSIVHNFLPAEQANDLLRELLAEAPTFERQTFKVFDNVVQSPHSACFYVESMEERRKQKTEYLYNGSYLSVRKPHGTQKLMSANFAGCSRNITCNASGFQTRRRCSQ